MFKPKNCLRFFLFQVGGYSEARVSFLSGQRPGGQEKGKAARMAPHEGLLVTRPITAPSLGLSLLATGHPSDTEPWMRSKAPEVI